MDYKKLNALRERVTAIVLPVTKKNQFQYQSIDPAIQKELAAAATAAASLLGKAKLVRGAKHQEKLVKLAEKLKDNRTRLEILVLRAARTALLSTLKAIEAESRNVFIVHGRDEAMRKEAQATLHRFGIDGIVLSEEMNKGQTIIEKFDRVARECGYAVVLFSPDVRWSGRNGHGESNFPWSWKQKNQPVNGSEPRRMRPFGARRSAA